MGQQGNVRQAFPKQLRRGPGAFTSSEGPQHPLSLQAQLVNVPPRVLDLPGPSLLSLQGPKHLPATLLTPKYSSFVLPAFEDEMCWRSAQCRVIEIHLDRPELMSWQCTSGYCQVGLPGGEDLRRRGEVLAGSEGGSLEAPFVASPSMCFGNSTPPLPKMDPPSISFA